LRASERVRSVFSAIREQLRFAVCAIWLGVKTALTLAVPLIIGWLSIPFFQYLGILLEGTNIEFFLPFLMLFIWVIGAPSVGALLAWALWGINPFKGVELPQKEKPHT
jgi:hypothetical protein